MTTPSPIPRGPWTDRRSVEEVLGPPVEARPIALRYRGFGCWLIPIVLGGTVGNCWLTMAGVEWSARVGLARRPGLEAIGMTLFLVVVAFGLANVGAWLANSGLLLLVGSRGFAEWTSAGATIALWDDIGIHWRVRNPRLGDHERKDVLFVLEHVSGVPLVVRRTYIRVQEVVDRIHECLRRNRVEEVRPVTEEPMPVRQVAGPAFQSAVPMSSTSAEPAADEPAPEPVADFVFSPVEEGPWLDSRGARMVGPVLLVSGPTRAARRWRVASACLWTVGLILVGGFMGCVSLFGVLRIALEDPDIHRGVVVFPGLIALGAFLLIGAVWKRLHNELQNRWLLGEKGLAFWIETGEFVVLWDSLGEEWRPSVHVPRIERSRLGYPVLLKLVNDDGAALFLSDFYEYAGYLVARIREELHRRADQARAARPAPPRTDIRPGDTAIEREGD